MVLFFHIWLALDVLKGARCPLELFRRFGGRLYGVEGTAAIALGFSRELAPNPSCLTGGCTAGGSVGLRLDKS